MFMVGETSQSAARGQRTGLGIVRESCAKEAKRLPIHGRGAKRRLLDGRSSTGNEPPPALLAELGVLGVQFSTMLAAHHDDRFRWRTGHAADFRFL